MSNAMSSRSIEEYARGASNLREVLDAFADAGFPHDFVVIDGGRVRCGACERTLPVEAHLVEAEHRLEGASDPADMQLVLGLQCPHCDERGTAVVHYGPTSDERSADVLDALS